MSKITTKSFRVYNAKQFVNSLDPTNNRKLYLFIGRARPWDNELLPPAPINKPDHFNTWDDIVALKRITYSDVKHVIPRVEWTPSIIPDEYDDNNAALLDTSYFYVKNSENNVYKCISNNYGSISTQEPRGKSLNYFTTSDNYKWKYMYSIDDTDRLRFETKDYIPVNDNLDVIANAKNGSIENIKVLTLGSNYSNVANLRVSVTGNGSNANVTPVVVGQKIAGYSINNPGINYNFANLLISGGGGNGANARIIISPSGGHGKDAKDELGAYRVLINTRLDFAEGDGDFPITNDYRTIGIIEDPIQTNTNDLAELLTLDATYTLNVAPLSGTFIADEFITGSLSKANAQIISMGSGARFDIKYTQNRDTSNGHISFRVGDTITGGSSAATAYVHAVNNPEVVKYTGKILFIENRKKIARAADQSENIHIVIEF